MYKKILGLLLFTQICYAQKDSLNLNATPWKTLNLGHGVVWKNYHFNDKNLMGTSQMINVLESKQKNKKVRFGFVAADEKKTDTTARRLLLPTSQLAAKSGALAAVNAGFFDMKNGGAVDYLKIDGRVIDTTRVANVARLPRNVIAAVVIHRNRVKILKGGLTPGWEKSLPAENVLLTGPLLLADGEAVKLEKTSFNDNRHPRTCACITTDKKLLLITVDGRSKESHGMTLHELTALTKALKCKDAVNFDGGGSTTMYIEGQPENGVVNYPSDNKIFDHAGERSVSNIFVILKK
ncbi:phosphodiester glycosidase family protein [Emticicia sp. 21SJ11W-3]|uniref:phosphodiester glycosidase family protein n=1 Tax=Emticicia sp. 21SJ11W-3 TaxID=2916755 RepID=UPI00209DD7FE|nr:phosphodiester glycosidase family protein [Emticicia sp. 21SJ11W-3]UTA66993.1 phosphodiester glycosidase family protein [Emticicia sp. 21SJ11W-3]